MQTSNALGVVHGIVTLTETSQTEFSNKESQGELSATLRSQNFFSNTAGSQALAGTLKGSLVNNEIMQLDMLPVQEAIKSTKNTNENLTYAEHTNETEGLEAGDSRTFEGSKPSHIRK